MPPSIFFRIIRKAIKLLGLRRAVIKLAMLSPSLFVTRVLLPYANIPLDMSISDRLVTMNRILQENKMLKRPIRVLEIGTWCAEGSTKFFAENLAAQSTIYYMDTWCPWASNEDQLSSPNHFLYKAFDELATIAFRIAHQNIQTFEREFSCNFIGIVGSSSVAIQALEAEIFDVVYIDGSHYYDAVINDIRLAKKVVKRGGLIIGNDFALDFPLRADLLEVSRREIAHDSTSHPDVPSGLFHPGVALALHDSFKNICVEHGLWWHKVD